MSDLRVLRPSIVKQCLAELRSNRIHPNFAGYLCLKRTSARGGVTTELQPKFRDFFDSFLRLPGGPLRKPYILPFSESKSPSTAKLWFNPNVAGSYAPGSLREGQAFRLVVDIVRRNNKPFYSLKEHHWKLALEHLAFSKPIPVVPLACFLYRDFAVQQARPTAADFVQIFRLEFGYTSTTSAEAEAEFALLYNDDSATRLSDEWFDLLP
jgi:hypothetical protein